MFDHPEYDGHEEIVFVNDESSGLRAIIAVHSTVLGPAGGGIRMFPYRDAATAATDVLRLSRAMTYKMAMAGVPFGGGKSVIIGDPHTDKTPELLEAFGTAVERLGGRYVCAEDVGTTPADMEIVHHTTRYVTGLPGRTGDTSPTTGATVYQAMRAGALAAFGEPDLAGRTVAVQGVGNVGRHLCGHLAEAGARIICADVDAEAVAGAVERYGATAVDPAEILTVEADVLAPCAMGGILTAEVVPKLRVGLVCGGANNQLAGPEVDELLAGRGIVYVPDYLANVGGVLSGTRLMLEVDDARLAARVAEVFDTVSEVLQRSRDSGVPPGATADSMARAVLAGARG